tara:strand:+ start:4 stop:426 length:423 start_codon:yes stop_codon:yes gene_type:complete
MNYEEFYYSIDCNFPYKNAELWKKIIHQSHEVGDDAPFLVLHEICRLPSSIKLNLNSHLEIYNYWKNSFVSPVIELVEPACLALINKVDLEDSKAIEIMNQISEYPKSYNALTVVLFSCPDDDEIVDDLYEKIKSEWKST